jgi:cytochrome c peroxidase
MLAVPPAPPMFDDLVARGEFLFFNERFNGNGRTCGTCHRTENNLTIDPSFIDDLPNNDPLFVAEFIDALNFDRNGGKRFENPVLMRALGLIAENQDGFGDLGKRFTMRGVPHVFAQTVSIRAPQGGIRPPNDRTGWGGDGAPFGQIGNLQTFGTLRDFAVGAVIQHFPLTLNRQINVDFRLPTDAELDALEAFQLSTGRQVDLELRDGHTNTLILRDANADTGRLLFRDGIPPNGSFTCNNCHFNAGANLSNGENFNFNTGVEQFRINHPDPFGEPRPIDGGFGRAPDGTFPDPPIPNPDGSFGNRTFNTASVVEMADTLPAFHNNIVNTVEEAVLFYQSPEFQQAFGITIPFNAVQVVQVSQFLRVINSLDNIDNSAVRFCKRAIDALGPTISNNDTVNKLLRFAIADLDDTIAVLQSGNLHLQSQQNLRDAKQFLEAAMAPTKASVRIDRINKALELIKQARSLMVING